MCGNWRRKCCPFSSAPLLMWRMKAPQMQPTSMQRSIFSCLKESQSVFPTMRLRNWFWVSRRPGQENHTNMWEAMITRMCIAKASRMHSETFSFWLWAGRYSSAASMHPRWPSSHGIFCGFWLWIALSRAIVQLLSSIGVLVTVLFLYIYQFPTSHCANGWICWRGFLARLWNGHLSLKHHSEWGEEWTYYRPLR